MPQRMGMTDTSKGVGSMWADPHQLRSAFSMTLSCQDNLFQGQHSQVERRLMYLV